MIDDTVAGLIESTGAFAEISALYYKNLVKHGVPATDAATITATFIKAVILKPTEEDDPDCD